MTFCPILTTLKTKMGNLKFPTVLVVFRLFNSFAWLQAVCFCCRVLGNIDG